MDMLPARTPEQKAANKGKGGYANVRETVVNDLLPTTRAQNGEDRNNKIYERDPSQPQNLENALAVTLMPTPMSRDWKGDTAPHERDGVVQTDSVERAIFHSGEIKLPTPTTNGNDRKGPNYSSAGILQELEIANGILPKEYKDWEHAKQKVRWAKPIDGQTKTQLDAETNWGKFEPAIRRWEQTLGRQAPSPTKPDGKDGNHRLSSKFTEWMMGLPSGWVTDAGLTRNDELKACGNGVVPQQAELALRALLEGVSITSVQNTSSLPTPTTMDAKASNTKEVVGKFLNQGKQTCLSYEITNLEPRGGQVNLPTPTVSDTYTANLKSTQQKEGSMHSVTLPQAIERLEGDKNV
jgi:hypothetical protein